MADHTIVIRPATTQDVPVLEALIRASARLLSVGFYTQTETEAAIAHLFGVDSELVADGTYFVAEHGAVPLGCGGWSARATLCGGDRFAARTDGRLDPGVDAARIRAMFVAPGQARHGVGTALLARCEAAASAAGFRAATLIGTLPGVPFYARHGYRARPEHALDLGGVALRVVQMDKDLDAGA